MGQPIVVTSRPGVNPAVMVFEINRSLTGMKVEQYPSPDVVTTDRPPDRLARRLFELDGVRSVTVYSSAVIVEADAERWPRLREEVEEAIRELFVHYRPGVPVPTDDEVMAQAPSP